MKNSLFTALFLTALFLVPNAALAMFDQTTQVEQTIVQIQANGSDTEWISSADKNEVIALAAFADTYNEIIKQSNLTPEQMRQELSTAANAAINQRSATFRGLHDVEFTAVIGSDVPELKMNIYPQTNFGYSFQISFTPQG